MHALWCLRTRTLTPLLLWPLLQLGLVQQGACTNQGWHISLSDSARPSNRPHVYVVLCCFYFRKRKRNHLFPPVCHQHTHLLLHSCFNPCSHEFEGIVSCSLLFFAFDACSHVPFLLCAFFSLLALEVCACDFVRFLWQLPQFHPLHNLSHNLCIFILGGCI